MTQNEWLAVHLIEQSGTIAQGKNLKLECIFLDGEIEGNIVFTFRDSDGEFPLRFVVKAGSHGAVLGPQDFSEFTGILSYELRDQRDCGRAVVMWM